MAADDIMPILFIKIACHGIKTKPGSVVVSPSDSWDPSAISNLGDLSD